MSSTPAMQAVEKAGRKLARINAQRTTALEELRAALRAADAEGGHTRSQLVEAAGVARQTVYDALRDVPTPDPLTGAPLPTEPPSAAEAAAEQAALDVPVGRPA